MEVLNSIKNFITEHRALAGVVSLTGLGVVVWIAKRRNKGYINRQCGIDYPKDTVIVHVGFTKGRHVPTVGQFCLKLITYLRATNIKYQTEFSSIRGPKSKIPWMEYNGIAMGDSQLIMEFCNKTFGKNLNKALSKEEQAHAWAIQKWIEEFMYWLNVHTRWVLYPNEFVNEDLPAINSAWLFKRYIIKYVKKMTYTVGIGRHTPNEISDMIVNDLKQFSTLLGNKKYIMGDTFTEVDCSAFGIIGQIYYQSPVSCKGRQLLIQSAEMKNVRDYLERIKTQYWPDWDELKIK